MLFNTYDSWGNVVSIDGSLKNTVGVKNPYRYRGYRYDEETKLYYLQSRYYNPEWGRFVNADAIAGNDGELLTHNLYVYAQNNPVVKFDPSGFSWETIFDVVNIGISTAEFVKNPSLRNAAFLAWDIGAVVLPGAPGSYVTKISKYAKIKFPQHFISRLYTIEKVTSKTEQITEMRRVIKSVDLQAEKIKFLGENHIQISPGKWRSFDGTRQVRAKLNDLNGKHGSIGSHVHFEFLDKNMNVIKNVHIRLR